MNRDQIRGMLLGVGVGDALGMPVECMSPQKILEKYPDAKGRVTEYLVPTGHKWFDGRSAGTSTDDTQLTLAVNNALIEAKGPDIHTQVKCHIAALKEDTSGWGGSTKHSIRRLANGVPYTKSGEAGPKGGKGNGVPMKIAPVAAFLRYIQTSEGLTDHDRLCATQLVFEFLRDLTIMTHPTQMAIVASFAHTVAITRCLKQDDPDTIAAAITAAAIKAKEWHPGEEEDDLADRLQLLKDYENYDAARCIEEFGGGSCYCYNSIPFTHMFFLRNPESIDALYDVVSAGGDADTNGSMVGAMLGAYNGESIFPKPLVETLDQADMILKAADDFCDCFKIK